MENMCILFAAKNHPRYQSRQSHAPSTSEIVCAPYAQCCSLASFQVLWICIQYSHVVQLPHRIQNSNGNSKLFRFCLLTIFFIVLFFFQLQVLFSLFALISNRSIIQKQSIVQLEFWNWFWSQLRCSFCYCYCWLSLSLCWNAMLFIKKHSCAIYIQF